MTEPTTNGVVPAVKATQVHKAFGSLHVLKGVDMTVMPGSVTVILGPSGSGKSTFLRLINQLETLTGGEIDVDGEMIGYKYVDKDGKQVLQTLNDKEVAEQRSKLGMVFQRFNLFPHMTALENVMEAPVHVKHMDKKEARKLAIEELNRVGMGDRLDHYPAQLSGGQQQRVAIARALIGDPEVLLCDEATSALDPRTTRSILALLKDLNARLGLTIVLITHQMQVVKDICTDLAVMSHGKVVDDGSILDVFDHPSNELTREFIYTSGNMNKGITLVQEHPLFSKERESGSVYLLFSVGSGAEETLMADIRERFGVRGNIMFGNVDVIHGTPVGMILVSLDGPAEAVSKALAYFPTVGVSATPLADLHVNEVEENDNE